MLHSAHVRTSRECEKRQIRRPGTCAEVSNIISPPWALGRLFRTYYTFINFISAEVPGIDTD